uniref:dTDP-4-dehydro-6-deoxy-alpha-D-glucopyranose 2,3-dehydratase n=1 Tax=Streptomyces violaceoruber TaxID=1935 RepID=GRA27_STRVN|nr:RecName: Full=dTDP-4-dehydro-6-deoxy-alpha-D-glucopyranose 2,3-dehydratase; AltName: Full=2,3-dehydratase; AltName: Full=Gra-orf27 protein [Streptomyces violaceoruber]CAA09648.1 putative dTDP-4-keto-6-deoxyglucose-3,5-epimerase [Streptomyces violaceoruber]
MRITDTAGFHAWFAERGAAHRYRITRTPLHDLEGWYTDPASGDVRHRSGRFFSIEGLRYGRQEPDGPAWTQPIIRQPETGVLGVLIKWFDGVPHLLMQAKMEPGNINTLQVSPTVQATFSNYTRVHHGSPVRYIDHFLTPGAGDRVHYDALQSEQGSWFLGKRNRNIVVETTGEIPVHEDFCWVPRPVMAELLRVDNLVNMDSRTVLAGLPDDPGEGSVPRRAVEKPLHDTAALLHWFTGAKVRHRPERTTIPLSRVGGWRRDDDRGEIVHETGRYFRIIGVDVEADSREVTSWSQPMLAPVGRGVVAFVSKEIHGERHLLVQARAEAGTFDAVELGPTVQCNPGNLPDGAPRPPYLDTVLTARPEQVLFDTVHSEEGGRFYHAENRYLVLDGDDVPVDVPEDYTWMTVRQLTRAGRIGNLVDVEARTLLACVRTLPDHGASR